MPLVDAISQILLPSFTPAMFSTLYQAFKPWHKDVFFYLCMEDESLWQKVFGHEYPNNEAFEKAMLTPIDEKL